MNTNKTVSISSKIFISISILSLGYVSILSLISPQSTMNLVDVTLNNTDALSSIRGIYGGAGLAISIGLVYLLFTDIKKALGFLSLFWGGYAISRILTILIDGPLGDFGNQWLVIESVFSMISIGLFVWKSNLK